MPAALANHKPPLIFITHYPLSSLLHIQPVLLLLRHHLIPPTQAHVMSGNLLFHPEILDTIYVNLEQLGVFHCRLIERIRIICSSR